MLDSHYFYLLRQNSYRDNCLAKFQYSNLVLESSGLHDCLASLANCLVQTENYRLIELNAYFSVRLIAHKFQKSLKYVLSDAKLVRSDSVE